MKKEIADDIEVLVQFASQNGMSDKEIADVVARVETYLATYRDDDHA